MVDFDADRPQTPVFGSLANCGHDGGSFVFKLEREVTSSVSKALSFNEIILSLDIDIPINIESECKIPFFLENTVFNQLFVNAYIQHLAFDAISEARSFFKEDEVFYIERSKEIQFQLFIWYTIHILNDKFLSITISVENYYGGLHPNNRIYSLNFVFKPDRKIKLEDLFDYSEYGSFESFIKTLILQFADDEHHSETLIGYLDNISLYELDFSFDESILTIYFMNQLPRVAMALSFLEIPINKLKFKL